MTSPQNAALVLALVLALGSSPATAAGPSDPTNELIVVRMCEVDFERAALLGVSTTGVMGQIHVKVGDLVEAGQVLGRLQDYDVRAELELRSAEAESEIGLRLGEVQLALAKSKLRRSESLNRQQFVSGELLEQERIEVQTRALGLEESKFKRKLALLQKGQAEAGIKTREVISPFHGEVVALFKQPGESVGTNDPILRVVDCRSMKVTGHLDVVDASRLVKGRRVRVFPEIRGADLPIERKAFEGHVSFVDAQIQRETQTCQVIVVVSNDEGHLRAGMEARIEILPEDRPLAQRLEAGVSKLSPAKTDRR